MARNAQRQAEHLRAFAVTEVNPDFVDSKGKPRHATVEVTTSTGKKERVSVHSEAYFDFLRVKLEEQRAVEGGPTITPPPQG